MLHRPQLSMQLCPDNQKRVIYLASERYHKLSLSLSMYLIMTSIVLIIIYNLFEFLKEINHGKTQRI